MSDSGKNLRDKIFMLDMIHIAIGILIIVLAIIAFLDPNNKLALFPIIFAMAGILEVMKVYKGFKILKRNDKRRRYIILNVLLSILLFLVAIISIISI